jgi:hypothetical protein
MWPIYFIYLYEDRTMKPVEIILNKWAGEEEKREQFWDEPNQDTL